MVVYIVKERNIVFLYQRIARSAKNIHLLLQRSDCFLQQTILASVKLNITDFGHTSSQIIKQRFLQILQFIFQTRQDGHVVSHNTVQQNTQQEIGRAFPHFQHIVFKGSPYVVKEIGLTVYKG